MRRMGSPAAGRAAAGTSAESFIEELDDGSIEPLDEPWDTDEWRTEPHPPPRALAPEPLPPLIPREMLAAMLLAPVVSWGLGVLLGLVLL